MNDSQNPQWGSPRDPQQYGAQQPSADPQQQPPYGQPQAPLGQGYAATQPAPPPQFAPPQMPPGGAPPGRGLPVGAWIDIGAGALVLLGLIVTVVLVGVFALANVGRGVAEIRNGEVPPDQDPPAVTEEPGSQDGTVTLDDHLDYAAGPFWSVPYGDDWDIVTLDQQGYNRFSNPTTGCRLLTFQGSGDPAETTDSDRAASERLIGTALGIGLPWEGATADPVIKPDGSFEVPFDSAQPVEMMRFSAKYATAAGDREREILIRVFMPGNNALYAEVDCPAAEIDETSEEIFGALGITQY